MRKSTLAAGWNLMNRQKKLQQLFKAKAKKANAKLAPANKNKYVSKADRLKLEAEQVPSGCSEN